MFPPDTRDKTRMFALTTHMQLRTRSSSQCKEQSQAKSYIWKRKIKVFQLAECMTVFLENPKEPTKTLLKLIKELGEIKTNI